MMTCARPGAERSPALTARALRPIGLEWVTRAAFFLHRGPAREAAEAIPQQETGVPQKRASIPEPPEPAPLELERPAVPVRTMETAATTLTTAPAPPQAVASLDLTMEDCIIPPDQQARLDALTGTVARSRSEIQPPRRWQQR